MSYYLNPLNALNRLREEWNKHNGLIVAVDFDSTLKAHKDHEVSDAVIWVNVKIANLVRDLHSLGCTIVIWTAAKEARHNEIKEWLEYNRIPYHYFNEDVIGIKYQTRKLYANVFLDDRAGLYEVYTMLTQLVTEKKLEAELRRVNKLKEIIKESNI
jgi:hypothetical protein